MHSNTEYSDMKRYAVAIKYLESHWKAAYFFHPASDVVQAAYERDNMDIVNRT